MKKWIIALIIILCASIILLVALKRNEKNKYIYTGENIVTSNVDTGVNENTNIDSNTNVDTNTNVSENTYIVSNTIDDEKETDSEENTTKKDDETTNSIKEEKTEKVKETKKTAKNSNNNKKTIVIDPGHQTRGDSTKEPIGPGATETKAKVTTGATGVSTKQKESELALKVALLLEKALKEEGYNVIMTRTTNNVNISNKERAMIANNVDADAFLRIHADSYSDSNVNRNINIMPNG